ncbi:MAG: ATP-binding cassette domain-containing protein, partial [Propionibacteriaceae bacterium]|nr:ATP-binding cassette domain-containing protein [Propionibacteriaceae bacterium]
AIGRFHATWQPARFTQWCERFELPAKTRVKGLSRGMGMKLQIAIALSRDTRLLVMDEPTSGLDPLARDELLSILGEYMLDERNTVLFSTHITADLERVADQVAVIIDGRMVHAEPKDDLLARYAMVRGGPQDLPDQARPLVHGLRTHATGFEGMVAITDLAAFGDRVDMTPVTLDELVIHLSRKAER